jgi:hypothetical protein
MTDDSYWGEVDRQPKTISEQTAQELNYLVAVLHGKRESNKRFRTRVKWLGIGIGAMVSVIELWDKIAGVIKSWHPSP